jgi:hypothetical protein
VTDSNNLGPLVAWLGLGISVFNTGWLAFNRIADQRVAATEARKSVKTELSRQGLIVRNQGKAAISDLALITRAGMTTALQQAHLAGEDEYLFPIDWADFDNDAMPVILQYEDNRGRVWLLRSGQEPVRLRYDSNGLGRWWSSSRLNLWK